VNGVFEWWSSEDHEKKNNSCCKDVDIVASVESVVYFWSHVSLGSLPGSERVWLLHQISSVAEVGEL
jgi:hypothetical protein